MESLTERIQSLQRNPSNIRNICILAHVDHGKTTLADSLIASNGIISPRSAGKLRYLDSRDDEQVRGITMKSSAISLHFKSDCDENYLVNLIDSPGHVDFSSEVSTAVRLCDGAIVVIDVVEGVCPQTRAVLSQAWLERLKPILVFNKIDRLITELKLSPQEACIHLQQVLEQVNAVTGSLFSAEILEKSAKSTEGKGTNTNDEQTDGQVVYDWSSGLELTDDEHLYFSPNIGNVVFASAADGWGFTIGHFSKLYAAKLGIQREVLNKTLWGDYYANVKAKKILKGAHALGKKNLFVRFVLENIWSLYDAVCTRRDKEKCEKIVQSLNIKVTARDQRLIATEPKSYLRAICGQWIPLSKAVLSSVCTHLPSPLTISDERVEGLMCGSTHRFDAFPTKTQLLKREFLSCDPSHTVIVFVSKMVAVDPKYLPQNKRRRPNMEELRKRREEVKERLKARQEAGAVEGAEVEEKMTPPDHANGVVEENSNSSDQRFVAFARVFSGTLKKGQTMLLLGPKHNPSDVLLDEDEKDIVENLVRYPHITKVDIGDLYLLMGRELEALDEVPAGNIVGIAGLEDQVLRSATLSTTVACPPFNALSKDTSPIIRVAVEPRLLSQMGQLVEGLRMLNQADPCVRVLVQDTGEHVIVTAGEVHLQRCIDDLQQTFAKIDIDVSSPIVPFRETVVHRPKLDMVNELIGTQEKDYMLKYKAKESEEADDSYLSTKSKRRGYFERKGCIAVNMPGQELVIRATPMPEEICCLIEEHSDDLKLLDRLDTMYRDEMLRRQRTESTGSFTTSLDGEEETSHNAEHKQHHIKDETIERLKNLRKLLDKEMQKIGGRTWSDAVDRIWAFGPRSRGPNILLNHVKDYKRPSIWSSLDGAKDPEQSYRGFDNSIASGFQLATLAGPLCEEPMHGVCFVLEEWNYAEEVNVEIEGGKITDSSVSVSKGTQSGQVISTMKDSFRSAFQNQPQRLMAAMYTCDIQATAEVLGKVYAVLGKREGRVVREEMKEGSDVFNVVATLPVAESFGFTEEIRKRTSGLASPQLVFSHWEVIASDPFWVPTTEEEIQHFGQKADFENQAVKYMNSVRRRKGLFVEEKTVEHAEKQRTLTKNK